MQRGRGRRGRGRDGGPPRGGGRGRDGGHPRGGGRGRDGGHPRGGGRGWDGGPPRGGGRGRGGQQGQQVGWTTLEEAEEITTVLLSNCRLSASSATKFEDLPEYKVNPLGLRFSPTRGSQFAPRPDDGGTVGGRFRLATNFYRMTCNVPQIYHYNVEITENGRQFCSEEGGEIDLVRLPTKLNRHILSECADQHRWSVVWAFDGQKNIYSPQVLFNTNSMTLPVNVRKRDEEKIFNVKLNRVATVNIGDVQRFLQQHSARAPHNVKASLEICLKASLLNDPRCISFGRSFYFPGQEAVQDIAGGAELRYGHIQSVHLTQNGLTLNLDISCAAFLKDQPVIDLLLTLANKTNPNQLANLTERDWKRIERLFKGTEIVTTHLGNKNKKHKFVRFTPQPAESMTFSREDGSQLSVADYWSSRHGDLRFPRLPCVDASKRRGKLMYLPLEVCRVVPDQRIKTLSPDQTRDVIRGSARRPAERMNGIRTVMRNANFNNQSSVTSFGIQVDGQEIEVEARSLPSPYLQYSTPPCMNTGDRGAWNLNGVELYQGAELKSWGIVSFVRNTQQIGNSLQSFVEGLMAMMEKMGLSVPHNLPPLTDAGNKDATDALKDGMHDAQSAFHSAPQILLALLPDKDPWLYKEIKRAAEGEVGVMTQCFVASSAGISRPPRGQEQYLANLVLKINQKIGGTNCKIAGSLSGMFPALGGNQNKPFIVFGADVTHSTADASVPSVGAIVASMDSHLGSFCARHVILPPRREILNMENAIQQLIECFVEKNGQLPEAVFFYRDGISDGQFDAALEHEVREFHQAFSHFGPTYKPPLTYIVVKKRHHARMFPRRNDGDRNENPRPGTVADTGITSHYDFDFYLNSHTGIQGTNKPAHYYVLLDENGFGSDGIQLLTYWMCFLYVRCTRSVSYAPPAYYAHLAALHGRYLTFSDSDASSSMEGGQPPPGTELHPALKERMFFV